MAIKEKLPTPSEIAKASENKGPQTPQQETPNTEVKFATEEIEKIQKLQADLNTLMFRATRKNNSQRINRQVWQRKSGHRNGKL